MKQFNKKQMEYLKEHFKIYEDTEIMELESWTDGGVDMIIRLDKTDDDDFLQQLINYYQNFDIDSEIDLMRESQEYRMAFTITQSLKDYTDYLETIEDICIELAKLK